MKRQNLYNQPEHPACIKSALYKILAALFLFNFLVPGLCMARQSPEFDEVSVFVQVPRIGGREIPAVVKGQEVYLAITDLLDFLQLKNTPTDEFNTVSGFFLEAENTFVIDKNANRIVYKKEEIPLKAGDLIRTESNLYLKSGHFGDVFGLKCQFNFRGLSVTVETQHELPLIRERRLELMRKNLSILKKEITADTNIQQNYPIFKLGVAEWAIQSIQQPNQVSSVRAGMALGSMLAGGEANIYLNYTNTEPFSWKQQQYLWRFVDNQQPWLKQVIAGKMNSQATSSLFAPIVGLQLTNASTIYRRSFGSYRISNTTQPGWIVELYVNNVLVDYIKADASGFYKFDVPLIYGNTSINLRFYGPWGEERSSEQNISVPFNFLPKNEFEYTLTAGVVEDTLHSKFSRASFNYGLDRRLTIGGGAEYLSSVSSPPMPFANASINIFNNLLFSGEYMYGVRSKSLLTYRRPSGLQLELNYINYDKNQKAINFNYLEERKAMVSMPIQGKRFSAFSRFTLNQIVIPTGKYTTAQSLLSGVFWGFHTSFSTFALFSGRADENNIFSNLSQTYRLGQNLVVTPQIQYNYTQKSVSLIKVEIEKRLFKRGLLNVFFEKNSYSKSQNVGLSLRCDFSFARTAFFARQSNNSTTLTQSVSGSLLYDRKTKYLGFNNRSSIGRGGLIIVSFLDHNHNGVKDPGEPKLEGLRLHLKSGRMQINKRDSSIQITELEPYTNYLVEIDRNSFDNIAWQIKNATLNVAIAPNQFKAIEIPVSIMGEVSGTVLLRKNGTEKGLGQIRVNIYQNGRLVGNTLTESDGFFSYTGLIPGSYNIQPDPVQLEKLKLTHSDKPTQVTISRNTEGDVIDGLSFTLSAASN